MSPGSDIDVIAWQLQLVYAVIFISRIWNFNMSNVV